MRRYYPQYVQPDMALLQGQFVLCAKESLIPPGWNFRTHGRWTLAWSEPLTCAALIDGEGRTLAWVLGQVVTGDGRYIRRGSTVELSDGVAGFQRAVDRFTGRFIAIDLTEPDPKLQLDSFGLLAAVSAPSAECVASTGMLIPVTRETPWALERIEHCGFPYRTGMYPLGFTPRHQVERVLPHHVLDLGTWESRRVWPLAPFERNADPAETTPRVGAHIRQVLAAIVSEMPVQSQLTAGLDSRLLLACARDLRESLTFSTAHFPDETGWQDTLAARQLASRFDLHHREDPWRRPRRKDLHAWVVRTGGETGEVRAWRGSRTMAQPAAGKMTLAGYLGELARAYWWVRFPSGFTLAPERVVQQCKAPLRPEFVKRAAQWLGGLPPVDAVSVIELLYLEQRGACWSGVLQYGELGYSAGRLPPMNQARLIRDLLRLPDEYRRGAGVHFDLIRHYWPELLEVPFNDAIRIGGVRGYWYRRRRELAPVLAREVPRIRQGLKHAITDPFWAAQWLGRRARGLVLAPMAKRSKR